jgi:hypothetical protein
MNSNRTYKVNCPVYALPGLSLTSRVEGMGDTRILNYAVFLMTISVLI